MSIAVDWHVGEVCSFLKEKELDEDIVALFREAQVDGNQFLSLNDDSLKALGTERTCIKFLIARSCFELNNSVIPAGLPPRAQPP